MIPDGIRIAREKRHLLASAGRSRVARARGLVAVGRHPPGMGWDATRVTYSGIVDERRFYAQATGHAHPLTAADYLDYPRMRAVLTAIDNTPDGALLLPAGTTTSGTSFPPIRRHPPRACRWTAGDAKSPRTQSFHQSRHARHERGTEHAVIDQIGLANPVAAHTARLEDGRIGHDKNLFPDWAVAEAPGSNATPMFRPTSTRAGSKRLRRL